MRHVVETLETRRLLAAALPPLPSSTFAVPATTYTLQVSTITAPFNLTGVALTVTQSTSSIPVFGNFNVTLNSSSDSSQLLRYSMTGVHLQSAVISAFDATGSVQTKWSLSDVTIATYQDATNPDGSLSVTVGFAYATINEEFDSRDLVTGAAMSPTRIGYEVATRKIISGASLQDTGYLATSSQIQGTMEFGAGQMPTTAFNVNIAASRLSTVSFTSVASRDGLGLLTNLLNGSTLAEGVYTQRDSLVRPSTKWRFDDDMITSMSMSDSTLDSLPRSETYTLAPTLYSENVYAYAADGSISVTGFSWNLKTNQTGVLSPQNSAYADQPTDGPTHSRRDAVTIHNVGLLPLSAFSFEGFGTTPPINLTLTADATGTLTIGNLASYETTDGHYAVKLLSTPGSSINFKTAGAAWDLDTAVPAVVSSAFTPAAAFNDDPYHFLFGLSEPVSPTANSGLLPVTIARVDGTGTPITINAKLSADGKSIAASLATPLPDGRYTATLRAGTVRDPAGNLLGADASIPFGVLGGDSNNDGTVNFSDLVVLAQNYKRAGQAFGFSEGNFDYSPNGVVDFDDLVILAQRYNKSLPPATLLMPATVPTTAPEKHDSLVLAVVG